MKTLRTILATPLAALLLVGLLLAACTGLTPGPTQPPDVTATPAVATPGTPGPVVPTLPPFETDVPPDIMAALIDETAVLAQVGYGEITIVRADAVTWRDGSLGCPEPGMAYIQVLTDGYWVVLEVDGQTYDWRMAQTGMPVLCPEGQGEPPFEDLPD